MTLIDTDLPLGDAPEVIESTPGGEVVHDEDGVNYFLTADQVEEYDEADATIEDDDEFNDWFRAFRADHDIKPLKKKRGRDWRDFWRPTESKPKFLSEWTLSPVYRASSSDNQAVYLAEMLGGVQSIVRALEPPDVRYRVVLSDDSAEAPSSYTSYAERLVSVSPQPLLDKSLERGAAIDITAGEGLHEVSHVRESEAVYEAVVGHPDGTPRPWTIGSYLLNLLEDIRIERNTSREYPGFAGYFDTMNDYLWQQQHAAGTAPTEWGPSLALKMNAVILSVKWPVQYEPIASGNARLEREFTWWRDWGQRYLGGTDAHQLVVEGIARLRESSAATKKELDGMTTREERAEAAGNELRKVVRDMIKEWRRKSPVPIADPCPTPGRSDGEPGVTGDPAKTVGASVKAEVEKLLEEEMMIDKPGISHADGKYGVPRIVVLRPKRGYTALDPINRSLLNRMREAFKFRHVDNDEVTRMLRSGRLDATQLHRWKNNDFRLFDRRIIKTKPNTHVTLLIDQSGSMGSTKLRQAIEAAQLVHGTLRDMQGVTLRVRSHTADCHDSGNGNAVIYRIWEKGEPMDQLTSVFKLPHINNADGYAIEWCAKELLNTSRPTEQRLLIVFSDGQPAYSGYDWTSGLQHVHDVVRWAEKQGVTVVQIAIDPSLTAGDQARMFTNWIPFEGTDRLPVQVTTLLKRLL